MGGGGGLYFFQFEYANTLNCFTIYLRQDDKPILMRFATDTGGKVEILKFNVVYKTDGFIYLLNYNSDFYENDYKGISKALKLN